MSGHTTWQGIAVAIPVGIGIVSIWQGDPWGWAWVVIPLIVAGFLVRKLFREENKK